MPSNFPNNPSVGTTHTIGNITWKWNGVSWIAATVITNTVSLNDLTDVTVTNPTEDEILKYNGNSWTNTTATFNNITGATLDGGNF
jgi:hypothetical protein